MFKWFFGYRCKLSYDDAGWYGHITVPRSHPIRCEGFDDCFIFHHHGEWIIPIEERKSFYETSDACYHAAGLLRYMQNRWDQLNPYEREYAVGGFF